MQLFTHPRSEELEENGLSISGSIEVVRGELHGRSGGGRKGKEEGSLFHHGCYCFGFVVWTCVEEDIFRLGSCFHSGLVDLAHSLVFGDLVRL